MWRARMTNSISLILSAFLTSLLADIRMQRAKIKEADNTRLLFLSRFFLEYFLNLYAYERSQEMDPQSEDAHDFDLIASMTEPASIAYVAMRMQGALAEKVSRLLCRLRKSKKRG